MLRLLVPQIVYLSMIVAGFQIAIRLPVVAARLTATKKVRISLDRIADFDYHTSWFTRTNTTYSTNQSTLTRGAYYTVRNV